MAVVIRMARHGSSKKPHYRIVAAEKIRPRSGRFIEVVGIYNPRTNPAHIVIKEDRVRYWVDKGAVPSQLVRDIMVKKMPGFIEAKEKNQLDKIRARRKKRKERSQKKAKSKK